MFRVFFLSFLLLIGSFGQAQNLTKVGGNLISVGGNLVSIPTPPSSVFLNTYSFLHDGTNEWWQTTNITELNGINKLTISVWVRPGGVTTSYEVCSKWDYQTQGQFALELANDEVIFYIADAINSSGGQRIKTDAANLVIDTWYHIVAVYDGTLAAANRAKIYIDGSLEASTTTGTIPTSMTSATSTFKIGKFGGSLTRYFNGYIDELYLFPGVAFTPGQVTEAYNSGNLYDMSTHSAYSSVVEGWRMGDNVLTNFNSDVAGEWRMYGQKGNYNADSNNMEEADRSTQTPN